MVPNSKRSDERLFHQDENSCRNCLSHLKPFSHSSLNRIQTCNKTCKYRDKGSKNLAASARIYLFVEALGSYSMVAIHCMSERGLHQYSSTFSQSVSWLLRVPSSAILFWISTHLELQAQQSPSFAIVSWREHTNCTAHLDNHWSSPDTRLSTENWFSMCLQESGGNWATWRIQFNMKELEMKPKLIVLYLKQRKLPLPFRKKQKLFLSASSSRLIVKKAFLISANKMWSFAQMESSKSNWSLVRSTPW